MEQQNRLMSEIAHGVFPHSKLSQEISQKKKNTPSDALHQQQQQSNRRFFASTGAPTSKVWINESKSKSHGKNQQKKARLSDSEFDIFS